MKKTIAISRPANGQGTVVTVTLAEDGITAKYAYRTSVTAVATAVRFATAEAEKMLAQAKETVE